VTKSEYVDMDLKKSSEGSRAPQKVAKARDLNNKSTLARVTKREE
jgi:hypothetical protein